MTNQITQDFYTSLAQMLEQEAEQERLYASRFSSEMQEKDKAMWEDVLAKLLNS